MSPIMKDAAARIGEYCGACHGRTTRREYSIRVRLQAIKRDLLDSHSRVPHDTMKTIERLDECLHLLPKGEIE